MENDDKQFQKGFNDGYLLSKHKPDLFDKVLHKLIPENEYLKGMFEGKDQHEKELVEKDLPDISKNKTPERDHDKERDYEH